MTLRRLATRLHVGLLTAAIVVTILPVDLTGRADASGTSNADVPPAERHTLVAPAWPEEANPAPSSTQTTFDDFNRTRSAGYSWGTASSGAGWSTIFANSTSCPGYKVSVNGQEGVMTGSAGAGECDSSTPLGGIDQEVGYTGSRPWEGPAWSLTGKLKVTSLDGSTAGIYIREIWWSNLSVRLHFSSSDGYVSFGAPTASVAWQANTWYAFKWVVVFGDQQRLKVWPATQSEPTDWLLASDSAYPLEGTAFGISWLSDVGTNPFYVDDLAFGPAPFLPALPPPPGTESNPPFVNQEAEGDPVSTFTGALSDTHVDVAIPGRGPSVRFSRSYNSNDPRVTTLGPGWTHSYNTRLVAPGDATNDVVLIGPQGRSDRYMEAGGTYTSPTGSDRTLVKNPDGTYTAEDEAQTAWHFDVSGVLVQIRDRYGNVSNLTYNSINQLTGISDPAGRGSLTLGYTSGKLTTVTDWASPARTVTYQYDGSGRLWKVTDREGKTTTFGYDGSSLRLTTITDARGNVALTSTYDAQGRVATQKDARGLTTGDVTTFGYVVNVDGTRETTLTLPTTSHEPAFHPTLVDTYDANGWLIERETAPSSTETISQSFGYDADGNRTDSTDARGNRTDFCYDVAYDGSPVAGGADNLTRIIAPAPTAGANRPTSLIAYDGKHNVIQTVPPKGVPSGTTVACSTDLSAITSAYASDYAYDAAGVTLLAATKRFTDPDTGPKTATTKHEYGDPANPGLMTRIIPPRGNASGSPDYTYATTLSYYTSGARAGQLRDVTDALGNQTVYDYDAVGRVVAVIDPLGNAAGGVPSKHTVLYSYDKEDRLRFATLPAPAAGQSPLASEVRYNEVGKPVVEIDARGQVRTYAYDVRNSLYQVKESPSSWTDPATPPADVITTEYTNDAAGNATRITRAKGDGTYERATDYVFDGRGSVRAETQYPAWPSTSGSLVSTVTYDAAGNPMAAVDPLGQTSTYGFDALNRLTSVDYADVATADVTYGYDAHGNRTTMTDGTGASAYGYDEANRLASVTSPGPTTVGYRYDVDGNRSKLIYPDATAVNYTFDKASRLSSLSDWESRSVAYTYWPDGLVKTATNPDASVATYSYDNARRLIDILHARSGTTIEHFFYGLDPVGNVTAVSNGSLVNEFARPDGPSGSGGTWTGTYASINEITPNDATALVSPASPTLNDYYQVALADVVAVPAGTAVRYRYAKTGNNAGKTINLTVELRQGFSAVIASQSHSNIPGASGSGWQQGSFQLTPAQAALVTNPADLRLHFAPVASGGGQGRSAQISWAELEAPATGTPGSVFSYGYDRLSRLTSVGGPDGPRSYTYDPVGNRLTKVAGTSTGYTYDRADRLLTVGGSSVTVDSNGNLTARGGDSFDFDQANRLTSATAAGSTATYSYDGDGLRFGQQVGASSVVRYVSDVAAILPSTIDDGTRKFVYGLGLAYAVSGSAIEVFHADRLGSIRAVTNAAGMVTGTSRFDEWGNETASSGGSGQPFSFTGEPRDQTGLTYLRARYYDPSLARFISRDTWPGDGARPMTLNRYAYANSNPLTLTDPTGRCAIDTVADAAFIAWDVLSLVFGPTKEREDNAVALGADVGAAMVPCMAGAGLIARAATKARKAANLPAWRHVVVDLDHVLRKHLRAGADWNPTKTFFDDLMPPGAINAAIRDAYEHSTIVGTQGERVLLRGEGAGYTIEMWFNRGTNVIETAYPITP